MVVAFRVTDGNSGWFSYLAARERPLMPRDGSCTQTDLHTLQSALIFLGFRIIKFADDEITNMDDYMDTNCLNHSHSINQGMEDESNSTV
uniref:Uncharacterized protein n=1 Tax=Magallana gigas TaxID=29159 RepID=K1PPW6_MAGGI